MMCINRLLSLFLTATSLPAFPATGSAGFGTFLALDSFFALWGTGQQNRKRINLLLFKIVWVNARRNLQSFCLLT